MSLRRSRFSGIGAAALAAGLALLAFSDATVASERPVADGANKKTYCAYLNGSAHASYCTSKPLPEAQKECNERLQQQKIEGTCECTNDANFIGDRCK